MNVSFYIARRYLFARKSRNIINIISGISVAVVAFVAAAMVCVMSAFSGIEDLVQKLFSNFDAPITLVPREGKMFADSLITDQMLEGLPDVVAFSRVIEEDAWMNYADYNTVATIKAVDSAYAAHSTIDSMMYSGQFVMEDDSFYYAAVGLAVRGELRMPMPDSAQYPVLMVNAPIRGKKLSRNKESAFNREAIAVSGIFSVNAELDARYVFVPIQFGRDLFGMPDHSSYIELTLAPNVDERLAAEQLKPLVGKDFLVQTRYDKNALIYQTNASEKWATFLILLFILVIASFNIIASLTMLIIEKRKDIFVLGSMGASPTVVRSVFMLEGIFINLLGALAGTVLGVLLCLGQQHFGLITMEGAMVEAYPVLIKPMDVLLIFVSVVCVGSLFSLVLVPSLIKRFVQ